MGTLPSPSHKTLIYEDHCLHLKEFLYQVHPSNNEQDATLHPNDFAEVSAENELECEPHN